MIVRTNKRVRTCTGGEYDGLDAGALLQLRELGFPDINEDLWQTDDEWGRYLLTDLALRFGEVLERREWDVVRAEL